MSPQQQVYDEVFKTCLDLGHDTYDFLPPSSAKLPFVYVGEQFDQDRDTKTVIYGDVQQTIHIYGNYKNRRQVTDMMNSIKRELRKKRKTENYYITIRNINSQTLIDESTSQPLLHGIVEVDFTFN